MVRCGVVCHCTVLPTDLPTYPSEGLAGARIQPQTESVTWDWSGPRTTGRRAPEVYIEATGWGLRGGGGAKCEVEMCDLEHSETTPTTILYLLRQCLLPSRPAPAFVDRCGCFDPFLVHLHVRRRWRILGILWSWSGSGGHGQGRGVTVRVAGSGSGSGSGT